MAIAEPIERDVEEVHCADCGAPMPSIPGWYALVKVRFSCDTCRQKSPRLTAPPSYEASSRRGAADTDSDEGADDADIDTDSDTGDDIEVDDADVEPGEE